MKAKPDEGPAPLRFLAGAAYPFKGLGFVMSNPRLWKWCILPIIITAAVYVIAFYCLYRFGGPLLDQVWPRPETVAWWSYLVLVGWFLVRILLWIAVTVLAFFTFTLVANVVAGPFNDLLSEDTEVIHEGVEPVPFSWRLMLRNLGYTICQELLKLGGFLLLAAVLLPLNLIPVVGSAIYAVLAALLGGTFAALTFTDLPMARRRWALVRKVETLRSNLSAMLGFGMVTLGLMSIPVLNLALLPVAVCGGTLLYLKLPQATRLDGEKLARTLSHD